MNLEIANRLVALRKENNLSQEALAAKLGISRQAVSKWERAEASPDTDNLIALAQLYHISLDELLRIHEEQTVAAGEDRSRPTDNPEDLAGDNKEEESDVHIGFDGIRVKDKEADVCVSWRGIHVHDKQNDNEVHIDKNGIRIKGDKGHDHIMMRSKEVEFPLGLITFVIYVAIGFIYDVWHPGWLIFFLIPIISTLIYAIKVRDAFNFAYPVLAILVFLFGGLVCNRWHPTWVVLLTIPIYYSLIDYIHQKRRQKENNRSQEAE